eukprot:COSAG01_NODE_8928_length_2611_cov_1.805732_3_plen_166_part_00
MQGCLPSTGQGIPQCRWGNVTAAQKYCSEWPDCLGFHCSVEFRTDPGGCGDCPQPAGSWCKCTKVESCQARGNGTKLTGGGSGDQQDYAYIKAGNATGWMQLPSSQPVAARRLWLAVSRSCACIGSPCLRDCVHGAPIGGGGGGGSRFSGLPAEARGPVGVQAAV